MPRPCVSLMLRTIKSETHSKTHLVETPTDSDASSLVGVRGNGRGYGHGYEKYADEFEDHGLVRGVAFDTSLLYALDRI